MFSVSSLDALLLVIHLFGIIRYIFQFQGMDRFCNKRYLVQTSLSRCSLRIRRVSVVPSARSQRLLTQGSHGVITVVILIITYLACTHCTLTRAGQGLNVCIAGFKCLLSTVRGAGALGHLRVLRTLLLLCQGELLLIERNDYVREGMPGCSYDSQHRLPGSLVWS